MGSVTVRVTCPECGLLIRLDHAVTSSNFDSEQTVYELDRSAIGMHSCIREQQ